MKIFQIQTRAWLAVGATVYALTLVGCGGGTGSSPVVPTPTNVPVTNVTVTVQLRDASGAPVEGLVTLDGQRRATTAGDANFVNVKSGSQTASAEVNGTNYSKSFVATSGANTVQIAVNPIVTTPGGGNPPAPPFGN